ncbi:hypothetical protein [Chakrabartyella piscis]|uniref:LolA family protein n=1 Tax=Chakrabartyella piscis TaxID=2918914 RepID=UPI002958C9AD|nr:hypothetical protein [Chakrabartyella piscis]
MKKRMLALALMCCLSLVACQKEEVLSETDAIQKQLVEMDGYTCNATLTRTSNKGDQVYETSQHYKSTGEYRLELIAPEAVAGNYTVFDGTRIAQYNPKLDEQIIKDVPESQHRNELFLGAFIENYMQSEGVGVEAAAIDESKCIVLEAVIGGDSVLASEKLWVDRETYLPKRFVLYDANGNERYRLEYDNFTFNPEFPEDIFTIEE